MLHSNCYHILSELSCRTSMRTGRNVWVNVIWWIISHLFQFGNVWNPDLPNPVYTELKPSWTLWDYNVEAKNGVQWKFKGKLEIRVYLCYLQGHIDMSTNMLMTMLNLQYMWCKTPDMNKMPVFTFAVATYWAPKCLFVKKNGGIVGNWGQFGWSAQLQRTV